MRVIIAGSRHMPWKLGHLIPEAIDLSGLEISEVVCGMARGADTLGRLWAEFEHIPVMKFAADWKQYGKAAGHIRNKEMGEYADAAIVFIWEGSRGSQNMIDQMKKMNKPCYVVKDGVIEGFN